MRDINIFNTDMFPYLEGEEIKDTTIALTITGLKAETMKSHRGQNENKEVLYFKEVKRGFVLNKTNAKRIAQMYGPMTGAWYGKQITLTTEEVQAFGELHNAIRVVPGVISSDNGEITAEKLLVTLNKVERISGFYKSSLEILDCRREGASFPEPDDTDGWRLLFVDARDSALAEINQAVENGDISPDQMMPEVDTTVPGQFFGEKDYGPKPPNSAADTSAMDEVEASDDEIPAAFR